MTLREDSRSSSNNDLGYAQAGTACTLHGLTFSPNGISLSLAGAPPPREEGHARGSQGGLGGPADSLRQG